MLMTKYKACIILKQPFHTGPLDMSMWSLKYTGQHVS
jgi:hypothetical protein